MQKYIDSELTYMKELKDLSQQTKLENGAEKHCKKIRRRYKEDATILPSRVERETALTAG